MLITISAILGALAAIVAIAKDGPRVLQRRGPVVVRMFNATHDFLAKRKALAMFTLLGSAILCFGTYYAMDVDAAPGQSTHTTPNITTVAPGLLPTDNAGKLAALSESDRPLVLCVPPFTLDTSDTPTHASTRYGREASRRIYPLLHNHRTAAMKLTSDDDIAHALDRIERDQTGLYDEKTQIQVGKLLNASRMIVGEISVATVRSNHATLGGQQIHTRVADVSMTVAVLDPETLERTCIRTLSGRAPFVVSPGNQPPDDDTLMQQAIAAAINKLSTDTAFINAATAPLTPRDADSPASTNNP